MPTAGSNKSRYVIPSDLAPDGIICVTIPVPDDPQWIAMLHGAIWRLSLQTHWERDPAHNAKTVAARWRQVWQEMQDMTCCGDTFIDKSTTLYMKQIAIRAQLLIWRQQWIDNSQDVQLAFFGTPDNFDTNAADAGAEIAQRDRALCLATESWIIEMLNQGSSFVEAAIPDVIAIATGLGALPSVPTLVAAGGFVATAFVIAELHQELNNAAYRDYLACAMYEALKGESTGDRAAFAASMDNLPARPPPPQSLPQNIARDFIETWLRSQLDDLDTYLGFVGNLDTANSIASSLSDSDCRCNSGDEWCFAIDFLVEDGEFINTGICGNLSDWVLGVGWVSDASGPSQTVCIHRSFATTTFTYAAQTVFSNEVLSGPGSGRAIQGRLLTVPQFTEIGSQDNGVFTTIWEGSESLDQILLNPSGQGPSEDGIVIHSCLFRGTGTNPFGEDNCV